MNKTLAVILLAACAVRAAAQEPKAHWAFEDVAGGRTAESVSGRMDALEGYAEKAPGVRGGGLRLDGFTACLRSSGPDPVIAGGEITVEAWIALGEYPWNWCPILTSESDEVSGYRLMIGPLGQASLECAVGGQWIACTSDREAIPLRTWMHVVGVYRARSETALYVNGVLVASTAVKGSIKASPRSGYLLGMVARPGKPSDIHRAWGTVPAYYGLDGILDEVKVYDRALPPAAVLKAYAGAAPGAPDIAPRRLPTIDKNPGRFGAFYTKLKYYPGWDRLWPVDQDPDVVVCFPGSPVKLVFWRGIRYGASWVSENENWMSDQSVEAWGRGKADEEGCFEHMQDRHCRFSHVRVIENTDARVVVHWRYAPVSAHDNTWRPDPKTGWECWIDEYYFIYPDASAIRKVSWKKGSLGQPRQFQETLALLHPGQIVSDLLEKDYVTVADYSGRTKKVSYVDDPGAPPYGPFSWDVSHPFTVQQYQFKSRNKPYICFEPGNKMWLRYENLASYGRASGCNHFPVGQARCDGRTTLTSDKPSHCSSFPISDPILHERDDREYWTGLYGMGPQTVEGVVEFGRSWAYAPALTLNGPGVRSDGYDRSERCYRLAKTDRAPGPIEIGLSAGPDAPLVRPAFYVEDWNGGRPRIYVDGKELREARTGLNHRLEGTDLVVFLPLEAAAPVSIRIVPE